MSVLDEIIAAQRKSIEHLYNTYPNQSYEEMANEQPPTKSFKTALKKGKTNIIAEFKRRSPYTGDIYPQASVEETVKAYEKSSAVAISILTNCRFGGSMGDLKKAREYTSLPLLRKDFIIDTLQIYESRAYGADAILLIAKILKKEQIAEYCKLAKKLSMDVIVEVHDKIDIENAVYASAEIFGINTRNLETGILSKEHFGELANAVIDENNMVIAESGIQNYKDIEDLRQKTQRPINGYLVGTALMRASSIKDTVEDLIRKPHK